MGFDDFKFRPDPTTDYGAALKRLKFRCVHVFLVDINPVLFKLTGNKDMHDILI